MTRLRLCFIGLAGLLLAACGTAQPAPAPTEIAQVQITDTPVLPTATATALPVTIDIKKKIWGALGSGPQGFTVTPHERQNLFWGLGKVSQGIINSFNQNGKRIKVTIVGCPMLKLLP